MLFGTKRLALSMTVLILVAGLVGLGLAHNGQFREVKTDTVEQLQLEAPYPILRPVVDTHWRLLDAELGPSQEVTLRYFSEQAGWGFELTQNRSEKLVYVSGNRDDTQMEEIAGVQGEVNRRPDGVVALLFWQKDGYSFRLLGPGSRVDSLKEIAASLRSGAADNN